MANTYPVAQDSCRKTKLQLKIHGNSYKNADCQKLVEYANTLTAMIQVYLNTRGLRERNKNY